MADDAVAEVTATAESLYAWLEMLVPDVSDPSSIQRSVDINLELPDGRLLLGTVPGVVGGTVVNTIYSRLAPKHRVEAWIRFLALSACHAGGTRAAVTVGRSPRQSDPRPGGAVIEWEHKDTDEIRRIALGELRRLIALYERGMAEPLPLYCCTSLAWAQARRGGEEPFEVAANEWESGFFRRGESEDDCHRLVLGGVVPFNLLLEQEPLPDEAGDGWDLLESSRFGRLARRLWDPLLDAERIRFP